ncbi:MAG: 16S rRNA (cytosine(1402)-N(4))-methyltransferase RsmH [Gammaproteobacteria bacterium]|nr:16S rRNA (cytosine(1402)-N(4))-methyltransferase RsmH [Gammaproteobacteria bacterium]
MNEQVQGASHHAPVLLCPAIEGLNLKADGCYVDGTFGRGGHSGAILKKLGADGRLLAIDRDPQAIAEAPAALKNDPRLELLNGRFSELKDHAIERNILGQVDGLLLDLGVSSPQLDEAGRGFSFRAPGPVDMRMDPTSGRNAADWLHTVDERDLKKVLKTYGEERFAARIARAIVAARAKKPIETTIELADIIAGAVPAGKQKKHPATRTFQAIRIFINDEINELGKALEASIDLLRPGGRLCVISFHSLEDRAVKRFMRDRSREPEAYRGLPNIPAEFRPPLKLVGGAIAPSADEIAANPRARSARLRIAERV